VKYGGPVLIGGGGGRGLTKRLIFEFTVLLC